MQPFSLTPLAMLYHLGNQDPYGHEIRKILRELGVPIRTLHEEDMNSSVGSLCGLSDPVLAELSPVSNGASARLLSATNGASARLLPAPDFSFLLMAFFPEELLDQLLRAMKEASIQIPYKAVLTKTNRLYRLQRLMEEVKSEHDNING